MNIVVLTSKGSWCESVAVELRTLLTERGHVALLLYSHEQLKGLGVVPEVCLLLGYYEIVPKDYLNICKINCCFHESFLPEGRGFAPLTWQILEGKSSIPVTLFEVTEQVDAGDIFAQQIVHVEDTDVLSEIREKIGKAYREVFLAVLAGGFAERRRQEGTATYYRKRTPRDSELDIDKSIREQFNLLRVCDSERYPAYFYHIGHKYLLKLEKG